MCIDLYGNFYHPFKHPTLPGCAILFRWDYFGIYTKVSPFFTNEKRLILID